MKYHQVNLFERRAKEEDCHVMTVKTQEELKNLNSYSSGIAASPIEVRIPVSINQLLGEFCVANVYGSIGLGAGGFTAIKVGKPFLSLAFAIHGTQGLGFSYGLSKLSIALE